MAKKYKSIPLADRVQIHVIERHIRPAREKGETMVTVRAQEVRAEMQLWRHVPAICSALDDKDFPERADVKLLERSGPRRRGTAKWVFGLD
jgi:5-methylcytosine-specific restriction protein B